MRTSAITATVRTTDRTGVEMEALTAVSVAALTLYDMIKAVDPAARIDDIRVLRKEGGKTGTWTRSMTRTGTGRHRLHAGRGGRLRGPLRPGHRRLAQRPRHRHTRAVVVADGSGVDAALFDARSAKSVDVIITSGGTGISPTDGTADATADIVDYQIPGLADAIRRSGLPHVPTSVLSRGVCGVRGRTLIVNLPGLHRAASRTASACSTTFSSTRWISWRARTTRDDRRRCAPR